MKDPIEVLVEEFVKDRKNLRRTMILSVGVQPDAVMEDLMSEATLAVWDALNRGHIHTKAKPTQYLNRIVRNKAADLMTREHTRTSSLADYESQEWLENSMTATVLGNKFAGDVNGSMFQIDTAVVNQLNEETEYERARKFASSVLSSGEFQAYWECECLGKTAVEVATSIGITSATVRGHLMRAKRKLAEYLGEVAEEEEERAA